MCREVAWGLRFDVQKESSRKAVFLYLDFYEEESSVGYIALYRKWRPQNFSSLVGQEHIARTLANAITAGRIGHAYLFSGPRGTGKTSTAKIFAKAINCEKGPTPDPCGQCASCRAITDGSSVDVYEIDAASNRGIDEIRSLLENVRFASAGSRYKVYIIDEVHMMTTEAFNALLKTLEEPPENVVFILATTEAHKVPATIQSRCQRFDFRRITAEEIEERLRYVADQEDLAAEEAALRLIALQADGGMRDALSLLDQCGALSAGTITAENVRQILGLIGHDWIFAMTRSIAEKDAQSVLKTVAELLAGGKDLKQLLTELSLHLRSLLIYQAAGSVEGLDLYAESEDILKEQAALFPRERLMGMLSRLQEAQGELRWSTQPRVAVEVALLSLLEDAPREKSASTPAPQTAPQMAAPGETRRIAALEARVAELAKALAAGAPPAPQPAPTKTPVLHLVPKRSEEPEEDQEPDDAEGVLGRPAKDFWTEFMAELKEARRFPLWASLENTVPGRVTRHSFEILYPTDTRLEVAENKREELQTALWTKLGREVRLKFGLNATAPTEDRGGYGAPEGLYGDVPMPEEPPDMQGPAAAKDNEPFDINSIPPEDQGNVGEAWKILGGTVTIIHEEEPQDAPPSPGAEEQSAPPPDDEGGAGAPPKEGPEAPPPPGEEDAPPAGGEGDLGVPPPLDGDE